MDAATDVHARLRTARAFLFDLDGTLVLGDRNNRSIRPLPGAVELLDATAAATGAVCDFHQRHGAHARRIRA